jgi:Methyltransferase domain
MRMKNAIGAGIGRAAPGGWLERMLTGQRRRLFDAFQACDGAAGGRVLSVGMKPTSLFDKPDYLADWSAPEQRPRITSWLVDAPRVGRGAMPAEPAREVRLPFGDGEFDWVFCNEVIEHAGSFERQLALVKELYRVARKGVFLTTPNRRHPLEFHTGLPLIHRLPPAWWRRLLRLSGKGGWASEAVLNPLDSATLYRFASLLPGKPEHDVGHKRLWGIKAHFFLMLHRRGQTADT